MVAVPPVPEVAVGDGDVPGDTVVVGVAVGETDIDGLGLAEGVTEAVGVAVGNTVGETEGLAAGDAVEVGVGVPVGIGVGVPVGVGVGVPVGVALPSLNAISLGVPNIFPLVLAAPHGQIMVSPATAGHPLIPAFTLILQTVSPVVRFKA